MPTCLSCGRLITPKENSVSFSCPSCGGVVIWRCERCRLFARRYKCPKCGFVAP